MAISAKQRELLLERITPVTDIDRQFKLLLYGPPGVGKTVLAATLAKRNFMITSEPGYTVLTKSEHAELNANTNRAPFTSLQGVRGYVELIDDGSIETDHLIIDNMSGIQDQKLSENMEDPRIKANDKIPRAHPDLSTLQDYQIVSHQMRPMMVGVFNCTKSVTVVCHARPSDPERKEFAIRPDLTKAIFNLANEKADVVAYMYKGKGDQRLIRTLGTDSVIAKSRITTERVMTVQDFIDEMNSWRPNI